ncbi:MAG: RagB/SusD family nutrient uptake outer membrane protein [Ginsengibacter sp.]
MRNIKTYQILFALMVIVFVSPSCKKQLEEKPYSFLSPNNFYQNESDAKTAINGVYAELYSWDMFMQPFWNMTLLDDDHVSGADWFLGTTGAGNPQGYWGVDGPWDGCFKMISRANTVLENVAKIEKSIDPDIKTRIMGEAHFLRGWAYFQLVQLYGNVPLRLKSLSADPNQNTPRADLKDNYAAIIEDFKKAETMLFPVGSPKAGEPGRVKRGVAKAFLAKTYLTMASGSLSGASVSVRGGQDNGYYTYTKEVVKGLEGLNSKMYFELARDKAKEVIDEAEYSLFANWVDIWTIPSRNTKENMWQLQSLAGTDFVNNLHNYFSARSTFGTGATWISNNHYKDYEEDDARVLKGVTHNYQALNGVYVFYPSWEAHKYKTVNGINYNNNGTTSDKAYTIKYSSVTDPSLANSDAYFPLMRFAEVLLIYAEAANEANGGPTVEAYTQLNRILSRVNASAAPASMTQQQFRSFVLAERAREFAMEGVRRFDLMRWGIYLQVMNRISLGQNNISKVRTQKNLLLPIPLSELNSNKAITSNNPGW